MGVGDGLRGLRMGPASANEVDRMLRAFYFLDERGADGVVGGCDVYEEGLASARLVEDRW